MVLRLGRFYYRGGLKVGFYCTFVSIIVQEFKLAPNKKIENLNIQPDQQVVLTNPDGSPAPGEEIYVEAYSRYGSEHIWANNLTSNEEGVANFVITEFDSGVGRLNIKVKKYYV